MTAQTTDLLALNREFQLILRLVNPDFDPSGILPNDPAVDWPKLLNLSQLHSIRPLIYRALEPSGWSTVPEDIQSYILQFTRRNTLRNTLLSLELVRIITEFGGQNICCATFKGPVLSESLYGAISLREFVDVDIIVKPPDVGQATRLLIDAGYRPVGSGENPEYVSQSGQLCFRQPGTGYGVDLHWKLAPFGLPAPFSEDDIWAGLQELPVGSTRLPTFSWEHLALFLAFHGPKERWRSLKWICDFSALCRARPELDWSDLLRQTERRRCAITLLVAARLCEALGMVAPAHLLAESRTNPTVDRVVAQTLRKLPNPAPDSDLAVFRYELAVTEHLTDKLGLIFRLLTTITASDLRSIRLPRKLRGLYYLIRPFRLAGKACSLLLKG